MFEGDKSPKYSKLVKASVENHPDYLAKKNPVQNPRSNQVSSLLVLWLRFVSASTTIAPETILMAMEIAKGHVK